MTGLIARAAFALLALAAGATTAHAQGDAERLRIHGSNPIDDAPMPALVEDWLL